MARSHERRDRPADPGGRTRTPNRGRCFDCGTLTRQPELCHDCLKGLCS